MASPIEAQVILCDAAVVDPGGKLHMLGAGWSVTGSPTAPQSVAMLIKVPWDRTNQKIPLRLELLDEDGRSVALQSGDEQPEPVVHEGEIELGRPSGLTPGSPLDTAMAVSVPSMPLPAGRYEWRLDLDGDVFRVRFEVRAG